MTKSKWPPPHIMNEVEFRNDLELIVSQSGSCEALIEIILALAGYHKTCYEAQEELADLLNDILDRKYPTS